MITDKHIVVVSGAAASGKTTLGREIAKQLSIPFIDKDDILESLFDTLGVGDHQWRRRLSRASDEIFLKVLSQYGSAVAVSFWRHPRSDSKDSGTPITQFLSNEVSVIEVHCSCDHNLAIMRFEARTRHIGHLDGVAGDNRQSQTSGSRDYADLGPLGLGRLIKADTSYENDPQTLEITDKIKNIWAERVL
ncbi:MAG: AAA family ATPase [Pseudomonadales bacterium]|nr:AAA family ATPase [Pseudomonadales bacterium]